MICGESSLKSEVGEMDHSASFNYKALDYMRTQLAEHQEFQNLAPVDKMIALELIECAIKYYMDGCHISNNNDPGMGHKH